MRSLPRVSALFSSRSARISHASHTSGSVGRKALALLAAGGLMLATACGDGSAGSTDDSGDNNTTASESNTSEQTPEDEGPQPTGVDSKGSEESDSSSNEGPTSPKKNDEDPVAPKTLTFGDYTVTIVGRVPAEAAEGAADDAPQATPITSTAENTDYFVSDTFDIGCDLRHESILCGSLGDHQYESVQGGMTYKGPIGHAIDPFAHDYEKQPIAQTGAPHYYVEMGGPANKLEDGKLLRSGPSICGQNENGVTCWDWRTGRGFLIDENLNATYFLTGHSRVL